eukprot:s4581_g1.t2
MVSFFMVLPASRLCWLPTKECPDLALLQMSQLHSSDPDEDLERRRFLEELPFRAASAPRKAKGRARRKAAPWWDESLEERVVKKIIQDLPNDAAARRRRKPEPEAKFTEAFQEPQAVPAAVESERSVKFQAQLAAFRRQLSSLERQLSPVDRRRERLAFMMEEAAAMHRAAMAARRHQQRSGAVGGLAASRMTSARSSSPPTSLKREQRESMVVGASRSLSMTLPAGGALLFWTTCLSEGLRQTWKSRPSGGDASAGGLSELAFQEIFSTQLAHVNPPAVGRHRTVTFVAYYPEVFRDLRAHGWGVTDDDFLHSICNGPLTSNQDEGLEAKRLVFSSWDKKYLAKTVVPDEVHFFADHLPAYHRYMRGLLLVRAVQLSYKERARASFDSRELTYVLEGGKENTLRREKVEALVEADPVFENSDVYSLSRPERYRRAMQKQRSLARSCASSNCLKGYPVAVPVGCRLLELHSQGLDPTDLRRAVHDDLGTDLQTLMFIPNIRATFSDEQRAHWLPRAEAWEVVGCYAQTELGHGSNLRGLETTATYLEETDEIEIHSTKWTANHAVVYARLIVAGKDLGIHNFMVQIRDLQTHEPLPGVQVGDIGPKIGYNNQDNGFCRFSHVRIPRTNMAMRHATLDRAGQYSSRKERRAASYSAMTKVRVEIAMGSGHVLSKACAIAIRYSAVRHQGFTGKGDGSEMCVLDYTMQQQRLLPLLATAYAFHFELLARRDAEALHVASSGLKALCSRITGDGIEACRRACGGHGYLDASGLPQMLGTVLQNVTVEGENFMIAQQTTKGLLKLVSSAAPSTLPFNAWEGQEPTCQHGKTLEVSKSNRSFQFSVAVVPMATNAPLLGKAAHSKASIFYGADEYLEELSTHENTSSCTSTVGAGPFVLDTGQRAAKILLSEIYT